MKRILFIIGLLLILIALTGKWATNLTPADVEEYKMWINLAKNGYAPPMNMTSPDDCEILTGEDNDH